MDQLDIAIHQTAHRFPGGVMAMAAAMGINAQVFRNKVSPTHEFNKLSVQEALRMMLLSDDCSILETLATELGREVRKIETEAGSLLTELLREQKERGDVASLLAEIIKDGRVTPREAFDMGREIEESIDALRRLGLAVKLAADDATPLFSSDRTHL